MAKKITIINGNPENGSRDLELFLDKLVSEITGESTDVNHIRLAGENIKFCIGCWDCWWKTPGLCRHDDSMGKILQLIIHSDLLVFSTPVVMGFYSALLKKFHDRLIPLVHPYIEFVNNEMHHKKRYPDYPVIGVLLDPTGAEKDELEIIRSVFDRLALNFKSEVRFFHTTDSTKISSLKNEISSI
jgi:multimeric flavodoxin WrbA